MEAASSSGWITSLAPGLAQARVVGAILRAGEDRERRVRLAQLVDGQAHAIELGRATTASAACSAPAACRSRACEASPNRLGMPARAQAAHDVRIGLDRDVPHAEGLQRLGDGAPHPPVAAENHVALERRDVVGAASRGPRAARNAPIRRETSCTSVAFSKIVMSEVASVAW